MTMVPAAEVVEAAVDVAAALMLAAIGIGH